MPIKKPKKTSMRPKTVSVMESEFHRLKNVEAKWKELCDAVEVNPHEPLNHEILKAVHQAKDAQNKKHSVSTEAIWAVNWEEICAYLHVEPQERLEDVRRLVGDMHTRSSHFVNLVDTLAIPPAFATAGGIVEIMRQREENAHDIAAKYLSHRSWLQLCQHAKLSHTSGVTEVIEKLNAGNAERLEWRALCLVVGLSFDVSADSVIKQVQELYKLTPPKNLAEFFRIKMPMMLDGKERMATLVVSTQVNEV